MRAFNIGTIHSKTSDDEAVRFRIVFDNYQGTPTVRLYRYTHGPSASGLVAPWSGTTRTLTLPHVKFGRAFKYRRFGGLVAYRVSSRFYGRVIGY